MAQRGPAPNPNSMRSQKGLNTFRAIDAGVKDVGPAVCPRRLSPEAKKIWRALAPLLEKQGHLNALYQTSFAALCQIYADAIEAERLVRENGVMLKSPRGRLYVNPAVKIARDARKLFMDFAKDFGLTPNSRNRLPIPKTEFDDPLEAFLSRRKTADTRPV